MTIFLTTIIISNVIAILLLANAYRKWDKENRKK